MESQNGWSISISLHIKHPMEDQGRPDLPDLCITCLLQNSTDSLWSSSFLSLVSPYHAGSKSGCAILLLLYITHLQQGTVQISTKHVYLVPFPPEG